MQSPYARSPKGQRAYAKRPYHDGERINLIAGLSLEGIQAPWLVTDGPIDGLAFQIYVEHDSLCRNAQTSTIIAYCDDWNAEHCAIYNITYAAEN